MNQYILFYIQLFSSTISLLVPVLKFQCRASHTSKQWKTMDITRSVFSSSIQGVVGGIWGLISGYSKNDVWFSWDDSRMQFSLLVIWLVVINVLKIWFKTVSAALSLTSFYSFLYYGRSSRYVLAGIKLIILESIVKESNEPWHKIFHNAVCATSKASDRPSRIDQNICLSLGYSMNFEVLTEHHLEFLSLKGDCTGSYESTLVKILHYRKSHHKLETVQISGMLDQR